MKIAFITSGFLPVPAVKGGAVETLVQNLVKENEIEKTKKFTIFSIYEKEASQLASRYKNTEFIFYKPNIIIKAIDYIIYKALTVLFKKEKKLSYRFIIQRLSYINYVSKKIKTNNYESIIIENNPTLFLTLKWRKNYVKYSGRYFLHLHNDITKFYGCKSIIKNSKRILVVSKYIANIVKEKIECNDDKIIIFKNCLDMKNFNKKYSNDDINSIKKELGIDVNNKIIIFVGRTIKEKGIMETVQAFKRCNQNNWTLLIVGSSGFDIKVKSDFEKKLLNETKDNKRIVFTGFVPYDNLGLYYAIANVAVLPSIWDEPAGLTMLEAVAAGVPVITTNTGGIPEYVEEYKTNILNVDEHLVENISESLKELLIKNKKINKKTARECQKEYNLDVYLNNFIDCIK